jgi:hypothetical protein
MNLPDIQKDSKDFISLPIDKVGVRGIKVPLKVLTKDSRESIEVLAKISSYCNLSDDLKGINMSRITQTIYQVMKVSNGIQDLNRFAFELKKVHRLIAEAFIPNPENKPQVNHINGIKYDNFVDNLEWVTHKENTKHAIDNGLFYFNSSEESINKIIKKGSLNGNALLSEEKVLEIRKKYKPRIYTKAMLALEYGVKESCIKDVVNRNSWNHI